MSSSNNWLWSEMHWGSAQIHWLANERGNQVADMEISVDDETQEITITDGRADNPTHLAGPFPDMDAAKAAFYMLM